MNNKYKKKITSLFITGAFAFLVFPASADNIIRTQAPILGYSIAKPSPNQENKIASCNSILKHNPGSQSGIYTIKPAGEAFDVYCDMTTNGGGWTMIGRANFGNVTGWATTREAVNPHIIPQPTSDTAKLSDARINSIPKSFFYVQSTGYNNKRYFKGTCEYNQVGTTGGDCGISYANENLGSPRGDGGTHPHAGGLFDGRVAVNGDGYYILTSSTVNGGKSGWSAGDGGSSSSYSGTGIAGTNINLYMWVR